MSYMSLDIGLPVSTILKLQHVIVVLLLCIGLMYLAFT